MRRSLPRFSVPRPALPVLAVLGVVVVLTGVRWCFRGEDAPPLIVADSAAPGPSSAELKEPAFFRAYDVDARSLGSVLEKLQEQYPAETGVRLAADYNTGKLLAAAPAAVHREIRQVVWQDGEPQPADAAPAPTPALAEAQVEPSAPAAKPTESRGSLREPTPDREAINDAQFQLRHLTAAELEVRLHRIWGKRIAVAEQGDGDLAIITTATESGIQPVLQIDRRQQQVEFLAPPKFSELWLRVVAALDQPRRADQETQLVTLQHSDPAKIDRAVKLMQAVTAAPGGSAAGGQAGGNAAARRDLVTMIFQQEPGAAQPAEPPAVKPAPVLPNGEEPKPGEPAAEAAPGEQPAAEDIAADDGGMIGPVQIEFLEGLDAIVLRGHRRDVERVQRIIADIERISTETQPLIEVHELKHVGSQVMSSLVSTIYTEILSARQGTVTIRPLVKPNALLLIGRAESVAIVKQLVEKLDQPAAPEQQFEIFPLKNISAVDAQTTVQNFFVDRLSDTATGGGIGTGQGQTTPRPGFGTRVNAVADFRTNSLIVHASPRDMAEVRRLIARLDVEKAGSTNELKIFRLKNALASDVAPVLQDALNWQLIGNRTPVGASQSGAFGGQGIGQTEERARLRTAALTFMTVDSAGGKMLESGILVDVRITADVNGNALIVSGPSKSMGLIEALITALDQLPSAKAQIKVFTIVNGDASTLAAMLQQLLGQQAQQGGQQQLNTLFGQGAVNPFLTPALQSAASIGESSLVPVRFGVDQRTNSIIASGSEGDLGVVEAILLRLDEDNFQKLNTTVYWLANSSATEVATAVNDWLDSRAAVYDTQTQLSPVAPNVQFNREVIVVPEQLSNTIIISATDEWFDEVKQVVESLDRRPPVIKIDVMIAEVALNDTFELGAEFGLQNALLFDRMYSDPDNVDAFGDSPGYNFNNIPLGDIAGNPASLAGQALSSFGLGRISSATNYGGLVLSASRDSVSVLIRALEESGRAQVLSRPTIETIDGQLAQINVGATVSRFRGSTVTNAGATQNIEDVPTGITMIVTPRIAPDGLVVMNVDVTKDSLSTTEGVDLPNPNGVGTFFQGNIDTITAQTTISARSGQTVVFSGLIKTEKATQTKGIPYISRLPVVGQLFRFDRDVNKRSELLIILSPQVVREDDDLKRILYSETERMSWCLADVFELWGPDDNFTGRPGPWCNPCDTPVIFPSVNPTGQSQPTPAEPLPTPAPTVGHFSPTVRPTRVDSEPVPTAMQQPVLFTPSGPMPALPNQSGAPADWESPVRTFSNTNSNANADANQPPGQSGVAPSSYQQPIGPQPRMMRPEQRK